MEMCIVQVLRQTGRPLLKGLAGLCAITMMSIVILDRVSRWNVELSSNGSTDSQLEIFGQALRDARAEEADFKDNTKSLSASSSSHIPSADHPLMAEGAAPTARSHPSHQ